MNTKTSNNNDIENDISLEDCSLVKDIFLLNSKRLNTNDLKFKSNLLINALNDFSKKYESDTKNILLNQKFLLTFKEIIQLIRDSIDTQRKIDELNISNIEFVRNLTQNFINNLSYNIFCFEKIDKDFYGVKKQLKNNKNIQHSKKNSDFSVNNCNSSVSRNNQQSKNCNNLNNTMHTNTTSSTFRKRSMPKETDNKKNNDDNFPKKKIIYKEKTVTIKKSVDKRKNYNQITQPVKNIYKRRNSSIGRRSKNIAQREGNKSISPLQSIYSTAMKKCNKKYSDIYLACENLNLTGSSNILLNRNKLRRNSEVNVKKFGVLDYGEEITTKKDYKNKDDCIESDGIQKKFITKVPKPSIYTKQLLIKGRKYINDFNCYTEF